jgi:hypothetical protein
MTMKNMKLRLKMLPLIVAAMLALQAGAQEAPGALFAASDGKGHISLLWFPPSNKWPAGGWKLSDSGGQVLAPQISMGDAAAVQALSLEDADAIRKLPVVLAKPDAGPKGRQLINILGLRAFSDPAYARALGLSWTLENVASGSRTYKVEGLDNSGKSTGVTLTSAAVDASQTTPLAPAPSGLETKVSEQGVALFWQPTPENRQLPVIAYTIERDGGGQNAAAVTAKPVIPGVKWDAKVPLVLDRNAPVNEMLTYRVFGVDVFGRRSAGTSIKIFYPDFHALEPPHPVTATGGIGKITLSWLAQQRPNLAGYIVERAFLYAGPYEALVTQALPPDSKQYEDATVRGGTAYYYRVRAVNSRGDLGTPSSPAMAQPQNPGTLPKIEGLTADAGQTRVRLSWKPVDFPVAGYFVERRATTGAAGTENWVRLNAHVTPEPLYDDYVGMSSDMKLEYRVHAVGFDNAEGPTSVAVAVALPDRTLPDAPSITTSSGAEGRTVLTFMPADDRASQFLVLRSGRAEDLGVVIGDPLPASARQYTDLYVSPGQSYSYRLVAVDKNGNRSEPTASVAIHVGAPEIPKPPTPSAQLVKTPFAHVILQIDHLPAGLRLIVERQDQPNGPWLRVAGPIAAPTAWDSVAPSQNVAYRISFAVANGAVGPPSDTIKAPNTN